MLLTSKDPGVLKDRVLVVSSFRLVTIKMGMFKKKSVRQSLSLLDLTGLSVITKDDGKIIIRIYFPEVNVDVESEKDSPMSIALVRSILR